MKLRHENEEKSAGVARNEARPQRRAGIIRAAALIAGLAAGGCGDTIYNYYAAGQDGGASAADTLPKADAQAKDSMPTEACVSKANLPECSDALIVAGVLNVGESLPIVKNLGDDAYRLVLDDGQVLNGKNYAIVSLTDDCGRTLMKTKIEEGSVKKLVKNGHVIEVEVTEAAFGVTFGAKWANFNVRSPCEDATQYWCPAVMGVINQGESLVVDNLKFRLDDIESTGTQSSAILSVLDANNNILKKDKIAEGASVEVAVGGKHYLVAVKAVAAGYTFGAKWAEIEISGPAQLPCGS